MIPYHKCTDDDWKDFRAPLKGVEDQFKLIRDNEKRGMFCIDDYDNFRIYGNEKNTYYQRFEIILVPCNYVHTQFGYEGDSIHPECIADLQK